MSEAIRSEPYLGVKWYTMPPRPVQQKDISRTETAPVALRGEISMVCSRRLFNTLEDVFSELYILLKQVSIPPSPSTITWDSGYQHMILYTWLDIQYFYFSVLIVFSCRRTILPEVKDMLIVSESL